MGVMGQVYLILDEFIMGGELQETSKKVNLSVVGIMLWVLEADVRDELYT